MVLSKRLIGAAAERHTLEHEPGQIERMKRQRVLEAAMGIFLSYGYKRATMDDIAQAADMSRPALYLLFRNKTDIFRAVADHMFEMSLDRIRERLSQPGALGERLYGAIDGVMFEMMRQIHESPHGEELLDLKSQALADLVEGWQNAVSAIFRDAILIDARQRGVNLAARGLTAAGLAQTLLFGLDGMKRRISEIGAQRTAARQLVRVVEIACAD